MHKKRGGAVLAGVTELCVHVGDIPQATGKWQATVGACLCVTVCDCTSAEVVRVEGLKLGLVLLLLLLKSVSQIQSCSTALTDV